MEWTRILQIVWITATVQKTEIMQLKFWKF